MGFGHTFKRVLGYGVKPKTLRRVRQKLGLTGKKVKKALGLSRTLASPFATSATTEGYHHNARTLSQLTGGV